MNLCVVQDIKKVPVASNYVGKTHIITWTAHHYTMLMFKNW